MTRKKSRSPDPAAEPAAPGRAVTRARMALQIEPHPLGRQARRFSPEDTEQFRFELRYPGDREEGQWLVEGSYTDVTVVDPTGLLGSADGRLPAPIANDVLVVIGEEVNLRARRRWDVDSDTDRTFSFEVAELLRRIGAGRSSESRTALLETLGRLARVAMQASGRAARKGKNRTIWTNFFDRIELEETPGGFVVKFTVSKTLGEMLATDYRLLNTSTYWQLGTDTAKRLYRVLEWAARSYNNRGVADLRVPVHFLRDRIPLDLEKIAHIKRALNRIHDELKAAGYIESVEWDAATADDMRRFPTYPGKRAKLEVAHYRLNLEQREVVDAVTPTPSLLPGVPSSKGAAGASDLARRIRTAQELCNDFSAENVGLYTLCCRALDADAFHRVTAIVKGDRPENPRAAFVRQTKEALRLGGLPIPPALNDARKLAALL